MPKIWILVDLLKCTGCRLCEIACSLKKENALWPSASRIQVYEPYPGAPVPVVCVQCSDYPCVYSCPFQALSINEETGAVIVTSDKCTLCGVCRQSCPIQIPRLVPGKHHVLICDLCDGDPECAKACTSVGYNALRVVSKPEGGVEKTFLRDPYQVSNEIYKRLIIGDQ